MAWQRVRIPIPDDLKPAQREYLGAKIVETILRRTQDGVGVRKRGEYWQKAAFKPYSEDYLEKKKAMGKYEGTVNLRLSDEMMDTLDALSHRKGSVLVGFPNGTAANDKAEWNRVGTRTPNRDFLGITKSELNAIVKQVKSEVN